MPSPREVEAAAAAFQRYLMSMAEVVHNFVGNSWGVLEDMSESTAWAWAARIGPIVEVAQGAVAGATDAYFGMTTGRPPIGLPLEAFSSVVLRGVDSHELWTRPPREVWNALKQGHDFPTAMGHGLRRAQNIASTNLQLAHTHAFRRVAGYAAGATVTAGAMGAASASVGAAASGVTGTAGLVGAGAAGAASGVVTGAEAARRSIAAKGKRIAPTYRRRTRTGSCELCVGASHGTYHSKDLMPIHQGCHCVAVPATRGSKAPPPPAGQVKGAEVEVHEHDELGPVLTKKGEGLSPPKPVKSEARIEKQAEAVEEADPIPNTGQTKEKA